MAIHEIVKYNPINYLNGAYIAEEWSSKSDIGKIFNGHKFTINEYMQTEREYIDAVKIIMHTVHSKYLTISYAEIDSDHTLMSIKNSPHYEFDKHLTSIIPYIYVGNEIPITQIDTVIQLCLREYAYIELQDLSHNLRISFGYDYYMKINTMLSKQKIENLLKGLKLYVDPR